MPYRPPLPWGGCHYRQSSKGLKDQGIKGLKGQSIKGSRDQRIKGPKDQRPSRPKDQRAKQLESSAGTLMLLVPRPIWPTQSAPAASILLESFRDHVGRKSVTKLTFSAPAKNNDAKYQFRISGQNKIVPKRKLM